MEGLSVKVLDKDSFIVTRVFRVGSKKYKMVDALLRVVSKSQLT